MRLILLLTTTSVLVSLTQAVYLPPAPSQSTVPAPAQTPGTASYMSAQPTPPMARIEKRCEGDETCADVTAGPEVPIAVTTTMMTTKLVPCTTTTTVIDSQTTTLTLWSTEVQTSTEHVSGVNTVTVWLVTPAPEIKSKTWLQVDTFTFVKTGTATTFWTETQAVQTSSSTVTGAATTWTVGGNHDCHECNNAHPPSTVTVSSPPQYAPPPAATPQPAWIQTTATGADGFATPTVAPVGSVPVVGGAPGAAPTSTTSVVSWSGNQGIDSGAGAPIGNNGGAAAGAPLATAPAIALPPNQPGPSASTYGSTSGSANASNAQGVPMQQGGNGSTNGTSPAASGKSVSSPFGNGAIGNHATMSASHILGISGLISLLVSGIVV
ncbi:hypothetical protein QFC21_005168 [Naganishia friedmannii]|uniref:Uncharacterized protein n=1 Tax=Naganishia friedmannii TaxID=89922 RepID=A0ACC2VCQ7_9TREE|nr:hypothetical protein QFC21_005168 [Naganishia friedmannii]